MTINVNNKVDTTGLLVAYDFTNPKTLVGPGITNGIVGITSGLGNGTGYSFTEGSESVFIPQLGTQVCKYVEFYNNYPAVSPQCCWAPFNYTSGRIGVTGNTTYTYSIVYKVDSGYTHPNFLYRYEFNAGGTYLLETATHSIPNRVHLGGGWYWAWSTFTSQPTAAQMELYSFEYSYSTGSDRMYVAKVLFAQGDYAALHPRFWPAPTTTNVPFKDMTGNTTATAVGIAYTSAGQPIFGNTVSSILLSKSAYDLGIRRVATFSGWIKGTSDARGCYVISDYAGVGMTLRINAGFGSADFYVYPNDHRIRYTATFSLNTWYHLVGVMADQFMYLYVNGVLVGTQTLGEDIGASVGFRIGARGDIGTDPSEYAIGSVNGVKVFNRSLSAAEIFSMFTTERGAYGV